MQDASTVRVRRVYEHRATDDGTRVLVDRLWPRGLSKVTADLDEWCKDIAPSAELRKWYSHDPERFEEFQRRYLVELAEPSGRLHSDLGGRSGFGDRFQTLEGGLEPRVHLLVVGFGATEQEPREERRRLRALLEHLS